MGVPLAIPDVLKGDTRCHDVQVYRCPACYTWDWALQGSIEEGDVEPGDYRCWDCGTVFRIEEPPMPYRPETDEDRKEAWKAVAGLVLIVSVVVLALSGLLR